MRTITSHSPHFELQGNVLLQERSGDSAEREALAAQLAAARTDAAARAAESKALRKHARALERQLRNARSGASLQDIKAVSGRDGRLVGPPFALPPAPIHVPHSHILWPHLTRLCQPHWLDSAQQTVLPL